MKKGLLCLALVFSVLFGISACSGSPTIDVENDPNIVVLTEEDGDKYGVKKEDIDEKGETKPGAVTIPITTAKDKKNNDKTTTKKGEASENPGEELASMLGRSQDKDDPFQETQPEASMIAPGTMPAGDDITVETQNGKPKTLLRDKSIDIKTLRSGTFTFKFATVMPQENGDDLPVTVTVVKKGDKQSMTFGLDAEALNAMAGGDDPEMMNFLKILSGGKQFTVAALHDGSKSYFLIPIMKLKMDSEEVSGGFGSFGDFSFDPDNMAGKGLTYVKTSVSKKDGTSYMVEEYKNKDGVAQKFFFIGSNLKRIEIVSADKKSTQIVDILSVSSKVDERALKLDPSYKSPEELGSMMQ